MFTGIIESVTKIKKVNSKNNAIFMDVEYDNPNNVFKKGDSISINGVCLTVTDFGKDYFSVDIVKETLNRTSLKNVKAGDYVNLEPAMKTDDRFSGHFVQGHIDGTGVVRSINKKGRNTDIFIECSDDIMKYVVEKGSICIDGISLTIAEVLPDGFKISLIPYTIDKTNFKYKRDGDIVNIETDIIGKYIYKFINEMNNKKLDMDILKKYGF